MKYVFEFPDIGEGVTEGVILKWKVKPDAMVKTGDPLVEMETDKIVADIPSPRDGKIVKLFGEEGDTIQVDSPLVELELADPEGKAPDTPPPKSDGEAEPEEEAFGVVGTSESAGAGDTLPSSREGFSPGETGEKAGRGRKVKATPVARAYAKELEVDITDVTGSGPEGRILKEDILSHKESSPGGKTGTDRESAKTAQPAPPKRQGPRVEEVKITPIRKTIARNMLNSKLSAAHMSLFDEAEISQLVELRDRHKGEFAEKEIRLTYLPFFVKATVRALSEHPAINSEMDLDKGLIYYKRYYNIGIAVDTEEGLVVPVIRDADQKELSELAQEIEEKARKARERTLGLDDFKDGTFTITSYGSLGGLWGTAVINYPQAGILGIGRIHRKPVVRDDELAIGTVLPVSLTADHRIVDGGTSTRFLNAFLKYVSHPEQMFIR